MEVTCAEYKTPFLIERWGFVFKIYPLERYKMQNILFNTGISPSITRIVCGLILFITITGVLYRRNSSIKKLSISPLTSLAPSAAISLGIFGTFLGIFLGLINFDTSDINNSIPNLLEGLKTAFITSIFGMASSLFLKYWYGRYDKLDLKNETASSDDPIVLLRQISSGVSSMSSSINSIGTTLLRCFQSEEEFSFISQLKIIRTDMNDLKREVIKSLDDFGQKVAELGTKAMIDALREVIDQFNVHLNLLF